MAVNKVVIGSSDGEQPLIDLTGDSVTEETLGEGITAHDASGEMIVGKMPMTAVLYTAQSLSDQQKQQARANIGAIGTDGGQMTGQLKTSFKGSVVPGCYCSNASSVIALLDEVRYSSGCMGSVSFTIGYTYNNVTIPNAWYNFVYIPHRTGGLNGAADGDNCDYGTLLLYGMTITDSSWRISHQGGKIVDCVKILDDSYITYSPFDLTAGVSELASGKLYFVYE